MFSINRIMTTLLKNTLYKQQNERIREAMEHYERNNPDIPTQTLDLLESLLRNDLKRIYTTTDENVLRPSLLQAHRIALITLGVGAGLGVLSIAMSGGFAAVFLLSPVVAGLVSWIAALTTIPSVYNATVKGLINSALNKFYKKITKYKTTKPIVPELKNEPFQKLNATPHPTPDKVNQPVIPELKKESLQKLNELPHSTPDKVTQTVVPELKNESFQKFNASPYPSDFEVKDYFPIRKPVPNKLYNDEIRKPQQPLPAELVQNSQPTEQRWVQDIDSRLTYLSEKVQHPTFFMKHNGQLNKKKSEIQLLTQIKEEHRDHNQWSFKECVMNAKNKLPNEYSKVMKASIFKGRNKTRNLLLYHPDNEAALNFGK